MQTQIRLLLKKQSNQGLPCLIFWHAFCVLNRNWFLYWEGLVSSQSRECWRCITCKMSRQTAQTQIRLLLKKQSDKGPTYLHAFCVLNRNWFLYREGLVSSQSRECWRYITNNSSIYDKLTEWLKTTRVLLNRVEEVMECECSKKLWNIIYMAGLELFIYIWKASLTHNSEKLWKGLALHAFLISPIAIY